MGAQRKRHTEKFKAKVALEAVREVRTLIELRSMHRVHPTMIAQWKRRLLRGEYLGKTSDSDFPQLRLTEKA